MAYIRKAMLILLLINISSLINIDSKSKKEKEDFKIINLFEELVEIMPHSEFSKILSKYIQKLGNAEIDPDVQREF